MHLVSQKPEQLDETANAASDAVFSPPNKISPA